MKTIVILTEGQCEETFIRDVVAPAFSYSEIFLESRCIPTSKSCRGGAVTIDRFMRHVRNILRQRQDTYVSTMLDLYALDTDFPNYGIALSSSDVYQKVDILEKGLLRKVVDEIGCRQERFIPYIQPYEFEGLLFSDVEILSQQEPGWGSYLDCLKAIRSQFDTPEHINNSYETKPSRRLEGCLRNPSYRKTRHGPLAAKNITLSVIERECQHFHTWMEKLRSL